MPAVGRLMSACGVRPRHAPLKPKKQNKTMIPVKVINKGTSRFRHTPRHRVQVWISGQTSTPDNAAPHGAQADTHGPLHSPARRLRGTGAPAQRLALKHGITVLNTPGTIDADYRGEVMVLLINFSDTDFVINDGERIARWSSLAMRRQSLSRLACSTRQSAAQAATATPE